MVGADLAAGVTATDADPSGSVPFAHDLAEFIRGVRAIDVCGRVFHGRGRVVCWWRTSGRRYMRILGASDGCTCRAGRDQVED